MTDVPNLQSPEGLLESALTIIQAAKDAGIPLCLVGGLGVYVRCSSARVPPLARPYGDLDFATISKSAKKVRELLQGIGYVPNTRFNAINAGERMLFWEGSQAWRIDIFVDVFKMCHTVDLRKRIEVGDETLPLADLLLTKLQIFELNEKDLKDLDALILDHHMTANDDGINIEYLAKLAANDWGLHHTIERNLAVIEENLPAVDEVRRGVMKERISALRQRIESEPKSGRWKLRARIGERMQWYQLPEEAVRG